MIVAADIVLPVSTVPIRDGAIVVEGGRIRAIGPRRAIIAAHPGERVVEFGRAIAMPGLVNAHTHLEYTSLGPMDGPRPFLSWIRRLVAASNRLGEEDWLDSARQGAQLLLAAGITCVGDIVTFGPGLEVALEAGLRGISFVEAVGLREDDASEKLAAIKRKLDQASMMVKGSGRRVGLSPHSVYTVSSQALEELGIVAGERGIPLAMHLAETDGECQLVKTGQGNLAETLRRTGGHDLIESGGQGISPVEHAWRRGLLHPRTVAVHAVHLSEADVALLAENEVGVALCPQSNRLLQAGQAPVSRLWRAGIRIGVGTDSLASNAAIDLFAEIRLIRAQYQRVAAGEPGAVPSARDLVGWITLDGARLLGLEAEAGSLDPGKWADVAIVALPTAPIDDPYDFLVDEARAEDVFATMIAGDYRYSAPSRPQTTTR